MIFPPQGPAGLAVKPLDLHLVNVGSIPTGPTHGEGQLQPHPGDVLKSTPNVRKSPRSGLNLEERLSDSQIFWQVISTAFIAILVLCVASEMAKFSHICVPRVSLKLIHLVLPLFSLGLHFLLERVVAAHPSVRVAALLTPLVLCVACHKYLRCTPPMLQN